MFHWLEGASESEYGSVQVAKLGINLCPRLNVRAGQLSSFGIASKSEALTFLPGYWRRSQASGSEGYGFPGGAEVHAGTAAGGHRGRGPRKGIGGLGD